MKKLLFVVLVFQLFLISCGKSEDIKINENLPIFENQIVTTGGISGSDSEKKEQVFTGVVSGDGNIDEISKKMHENIVNLLKGNKKQTMYSINSNDNKVNVKNIVTGKISNIGEYIINPGYINNYKKIEHGEFWNILYSNKVNVFNIDNNFFALLGEVSYMNQGDGVGHIFYGENKKGGFSENQTYEINLSISETECPFNGQILIKDGVIYTGPSNGSKCGGCTEISSFDINKKQFLFRTNKCDINL